MRGTRGPGGQLPAVAVPAPAHRATDHRHEGGDRRLQRCRLPAESPRTHLLPGAVRRPDGDRPVSAVDPQAANPQATDTADALRQRAAELDAADPLAGYRGHFIGTDTDLSYLDGNSLGRPLKRTSGDISTFIHEGWGGRLIRGWDEEWLDLPHAIGDQLGRSVLGVAPGQTVIADSTTVVLYKLIRAALAAVTDPARTDIVLDTDNFPTDRYLLEGIAREEG